MESELRSALILLGFLFICTAGVSFAILRADRQLWIPTTAIVTKADGGFAEVSYTASGGRQLTTRVDAPTAKVGDSIALAYQSDEPDTTALQERLDSFPYKTASLAVLGVAMTLAGALSAKKA